MKRVVVPLAPGFEEIEAVAVVDILRRAGVEVIVAGLARGLIVGSHGIGICADVALEEIACDGFDMIVLPGGQPGTSNLKADPRVKALIRQVAERGGYTTAICAAPTVLAVAGITDGRAVTSHPSVRQELTDCNYREDRVVVDDHVITSRGAGTAVEFALQLVELLCGREAAGKISSAILAQ